MVTAMDNKADKSDQVSADIWSYDCGKYHGCMNVTGKLIRIVQSVNLCMVWILTVTLLME